MSTDCRTPAFGRAGLGLAWASLILAGLVQVSAAMAASASADTAAAAVDNTSNVGNLRYGSRGLEYQRGETDLWVGLRFQTRIDSFESEVTLAPGDLEDKDTRLEMRRARIKGGGQLLRDWLTIYSEYDFPSTTLLDYRATVSVAPWLDVRFGQWKSEFNRERVDSSGKQQFVERSIANDWFTVDRQHGLAGAMRFAEGTRADTSIWLEALAGTGRGGDIGGGSGLYLARVQWNPAGEVLAFSQSDLARSRQMLPSIAVAHVRGDSPFTSFSSSGGGSLPGFEVGDFRLEQWLIETAFHYQGWSWQQELHFKKIRDRDTGEIRRIAGGYLQLGSFLHEWWPALPEPLEVASRYAWVDPNRDDVLEDQREWTIGANWFFNGHRNKLTVDYSWIRVEEPTLQASTRRLRLQWELSI